MCKNFTQFQIPGINEDPMHLNINTLVRAVSLNF
jgi:hypothetical protein